MTDRLPSASSTADREIVITRVVNAPRPLVWKAWTTPGHIEQWWGPSGFTTTTHEINVKVGGVWRFIMHGPDGTDYPNRITYRDLTEPERITYLHDSGIDNDPSAFEATITFDAQGGRTLVTLRSVFATAERRAFVVEKYGAIEGGKQHLGRLEAFILASNTGTSYTSEGPDLVVSRMFDATPALLYSVWTRPERMVKWFGGPEGFTAPVCELDVRPGGTWRFVMRSPEGVDYPLTGTYREVVPQNRLVLTASVAEHPAEWHAWLRTMLPEGHPAPSPEMLWTVTFEPVGERTRMSIRLHFPDAAIRDAHVRGGTEHGWNAAMQRLTDLIPTL